MHKPLGSAAIVHRVSAVGLYRKWWLPFVWLHLCLLIRMSQLAYSSYKYVYHAADDSRGF